MTLQECLAAIQKASGVGVCSVDDSSSWLNIASLVIGIGASLAIIATAIFAWRQLSYFRRQLDDGDEGVAAQIRSAKDNARLSATLDLLVHMQTNEHWRENRLKFVELRDHEDGLKKYGQKPTEGAMCVRAQLNQYELIAIGIRKGILDEEMYKIYYKGTTIRDWDACIEFIKAERFDNPMYWVELEALVNRLRGIHPAH